MIEQNAKAQIFISKLTDIILANLEDENFGIKELSRETALSQRSINRKLKSISGKTLSQFIRETRLHKAMEMLQNSDITASEVAYKVGFGSPTYFNTCFHEYFGYSPGTLKKADFETIRELSIDLKTEIPKQKPSVRRTSLTYIVCSGILILAVLVYLVYTVFFKNPYNNSTPPFKYLGNSIAVLPFKNMSDSINNRYFIDGLMEEILTDLSRIHDLRVISRSSVEQFRESTNSTSDIANKLHVNYIVEGSGQKYGNTFRLRVQLIEASTDRHIWAESFEQEVKEVKDIFGIQSHIAQVIASELKASITTEEKLIIEKLPTRSLTAYDFFQRGKDELDKHPYPEFNHEAVRRAEVLFHKALEYDLTFARAYTGLAEVLWIKRDRDNSIGNSNLLNNYLDSMLVLSGIALSYDDKLSEAYIIRGAYYSSKGNINKALEELDKAIKCNPNDYSAYWNKVFLYQNLDLVKQLENVQKAATLNRGLELPGILRETGYIYYDAGFPEKGNDFYLEALKLDGDSIKYSDDLFWFIGSHQGDFKKAIEYFETRYLKDSADAVVLDLLGYFNSFLGQYQESLKFAKKYISLLKSRGQTDPPLEPFIGNAYLQNGYTKEAEYYFDKQIEVVDSHLYKSRPEASIYVDYALADIYSCKGYKQKAYEYLKIFDQAKTVSLDWVILIKNDPLFSSIRNEPGFQQIVSNVEARYQSEHERVRKWMEDHGVL
jgi:TolB-like protein/AraC-like DNA-binding protein/tetratricopeptide (TPR) repeat protein